MELYYLPGACSLASHIMLHEVGAKFDIESVDVDRFGEFFCKTGLFYIFFSVPINFN